ncbi:hypothetical protein HDU86_004049 [Geranomyces michiganensis]|nr:hypothetical protein HDU86_004049 [Geranomyces michiganensis]
MLLLQLRKHPIRRLLARRCLGGSAPAPRRFAATPLRPRAASKALPARWIVRHYSSLAARFHSEFERLSQDSPSFPAFFGVRIGLPDEPIQEMVEQQVAELYWAMEWYLLELGIAWPAKLRPVSRSEIERGAHFSQPEDPWVLYKTLAHDPESLGHCERALFSAVLDYVCLTVDSPQVCLDRCSRILVDIYEAGSKPSEEDWSLVMRAYERWGKLSDVDYMAREAIRLNRLGTLFSSQPGKPLPMESSLFPLLLKAYTDEGSLFAVKLIIAHMKAICALNAPLYEEILQALALLKDTDGVYRTYTEVLEDGILPSRAIYKQVLHALSLCMSVKLPDQRSGRVRPHYTDVLAEQVIAKALPEYVDASLFAYTIQVYARHNKLGHAEELVAHMRQIGLHVDARIALSLYFLYLKNNRRSAATNIVRRLMADRTRLLDPCDPSFHHFVLCAMVSCGKKSDALLYFEQTKKLGVKLEEKSLSMLIDRFAKWRPLRAYKVYVRMLEVEVEPSAKTNRVIRGILVEKNMQAELADLDRREQEAAAKREYDPTTALPIPLIESMYDEEFD